MYLIRLFIILIYLVLTSPLIHANGDQCYLSVTMNDQTIVEKEEEEYVEKEISLKLDNGLTKNWDIVTKELGYENVKSMIDYHKNHEKKDDIFRVVYHGRFSRLHDIESLRKISLKVNIFISWSILLE